MLAIRTPLLDALTAPFETPWNHPEARWQWQSFSPAADVRETERGYLIELDVPGLGEKEIQVTLENKHLMLKGERKPVDGADFTRQERPFGSFERIFHLPDDADASRVEARARNGVLTVEIPKLEAARARSIAVKVE